MEKESKDIIQNLNKKSALRSLSTHLLHSLFEFYYEYYKVYNNRFRFHQKTNQSMLIVVAIVETIEIHSLLLMRDSEEYDPSWFSTVFKLLRSDYLLAYYGIFELGFLILASALTLIFIAFGYYFIMISVYNEKKQAVVYLFHYPMQIIKKMWYVAFMSVLIGMFKNTYDGNPDEKYEDIDTTFTGSSWQGYIGLVCGILLTILNIFEALFNYEQFMGRMNKDLLTRSHGGIEAFKIFFLCLVILGTFFLKEIREGLIEALSMVVFLILGCWYIYYLPFYHNLSNFIYSAQCLSVIQYIIGMILRIWVKSNLLIVLIIGVINPVSFLLLWELIKTREEYIKSHYEETENLNSVFEYELILRSHFKRYLEGKLSEYPKIKKILIEANDRFEDSKFPALWWFTIAFFELKKEDISHVKLSLASRTKFSLESDYHYYKYKQVLKDFSVDYIEESDFVKFSTLFNEAMQADKAVCRLQLLFWAELSREKMNEKTLQELGEKLSKAMVEFISVNENLIALYPENYKALHLYGSFLAEFYNEQEKGNDYLSRSEYIKQTNEKKNKKLQRMDYFDEHMGIITIGSHRSNIGVILSINKEACDILQVTEKMATKMNINTFLIYPWSMNKLHNEYMLKFVEYCDQVVVATTVENVIVDYNGFLVEILILSKILSVGHLPFYLTAIRRYPGQREAAIIDENESIVVNTQLFAVLLELSPKPEQLNNAMLSSVIPNYEQARNIILNRGIYKIRTIMNKHLYISLKNYKVGSVILRAIIVTKSKSEKASWMNEDNNNRPDKFFSSTKRYKNRGTEIINKLKGILKPPRAKLEKQLKVKFDSDIEIFEIEETDFNPGEKHAGKSKDAEMKKIAEHEQIDESHEEIRENCQIVDLNSLVSLEQHFDNESIYSESEIFERSSKQDGSASKMSMASSASGASASISGSAIVFELRESTRRDIFRFKLILIISIVLMIICNMTTVIYSEIVVATFTDIINLSSLNEQYRLVSQLSLDSRIAQLTSEGYINYREFSEVVLDLAENVDRINQIHEKTKEVMDSVSTIGKLYKSHKYITLVKVDFTFQEDKMNLDNIIQKIIIEGQTLAGLNEILSEDPHFYFLYRNSMFETAAALNHTLHKIQEFTEEEIYLLSNTILLMITCTLFVLVFSFLLCILPILRALEKGNQRVWRIFFCLPLDTILEIKERLEDRMDTLHATDSVDNEPKRFKDIEIRKKLRPHKEYWYILKRLLLFYSVTMVMIYLIFLYGYEGVSTTMKIKTDVSLESTERIVFLYNICFLNQEIQFLDSESSYYTISPEFEIVSDFNKELMKEIENLEKKELEIILEKYRNTGQNSEHTDLLFDKGCQDTDFLNYGTHTALELFLQESHPNLIEELVKEGNKEWVLDKTEEISTCLEELIELYEEEFDNLIEDGLRKQVLVCVCYSILTIFMFLIFYIPTLNTVRRRIEDMWELARLIPNSQRRLIIKILNEVELCKSVESFQTKEENEDKLEYFDILFKDIKEE